LVASLEVTFPTCLTKLNRTIRKGQSTL